jgi:FSR family fosmidomycin resistance protein-like MFS transporter
MASFTNYYTFYLIEKFQLSMHDAQFYLFAFLLAVAIGTIVGGPIGDKVGRKSVIWWSILGVAPFTMLLPFVGLFWTAVLSVIIGVVLSSAFSAILVFAQELVPGRVGAISGLFFGLAFGIAGIGAAFLGNIADIKGVQYIYQLCAFLPLLGIATVFLPNIKE